MIEVPYLAAFNLTRSFLPEMLARGSGSLAYITSPGSFIAWPNASAYIAARRAVAGLADTLQSELKGTGVFVTLVVLGPVESGYWEHNPGSRERLPASNPILAPVLSCDQAAEAIFQGVEARKRMVVKPAIFRRAIRAQRAVPAPGRTPASPRRPQAILIFNGVLRRSRRSAPC